MKTVLVVFVTLAIFAIAGYFGFQYLKTQSTQTPTTQKNLVVTKTGTLSKADPTQATDFTHILTSGSETVKLNSYTVNLSPYEGKTTTVSGQYSGTTLFVDAIK